MAKLPKVNLLVRILAAIAIGIGLGFVLPGWAARLFVTFNAFFSSFLKLCVPLIILAFVAPAIAELGRGAGRLLVLTVALAYFSTTAAGFLSYFASDWLFPSMIAPDRFIESLASSAGHGLEPYFAITMPFGLNVTTTLVLAFILGLGCSLRPCAAMLAWLRDLREIVQMVISGFVIPLLPLYIMGIFIDMTITGEVAGIVKAFARIIGVIFVMHVGILVIEYCIAALFARRETPTRNPLKMLRTMAPAYFTALGTSSSAATIPVTLRQAVKMGVRPEVAGFTVPLCATVHMSGSALKITACAVALMVMHGIHYDFASMAGFVAMLGVTIVAAPGVPGGVIMASLGLLSSVLHFSEADNALMIALYITMDSFGTACNVTGDGALSVIVDRFAPARHLPSQHPAEASRA